MDFCDVSCCVGFEAGGADGAWDFEEANGFTGCEAEVVGAVGCAEVGAVDVDGACEGEVVGAHFRVVGFEGH